MRALAAAALLLLAACGAPETRPYTLYRSSPYNAALRVHFATFDAADPAASGEGSPNQGDCELAAKALNENWRRENPAAAMTPDDPHAALHPVRFWCELNSYRR